MRAEYRRPRDVLLSLVGEFIGRCTVRLAELAKRSGQEGKPVELLDTRSHVVKIFFCDFSIQNELFQIDINVFRD